MRAGGPGAQQWHAQKRRGRGRRPPTPPTRTCCGQDLLWGNESPCRGVPPKVKHEQEGEGVGHGAADRWAGRQVGGRAGGRAARWARQAGGQGRNAAVSPQCGAHAQRASHARRRVNKRAGTAPERPCLPTALSRGRVGTQPACLYSFSGCVTLASTCTCARPCELGAGCRRHGTRTFPGQPD